MAKGKSDLILRDRLQFTLNAAGTLDVVYGRVDLSDFTSVVNNEGLAIKETRIMLRNPADQTGSLNPSLLGGLGSGFQNADIMVFGTTTAYEDASDVGIGSPNTFFQANMRTCQFEDGVGNVLFSDNDYVQYGTPDLHPDGYTVVSDVLIGIAASNCQQYANATLECDIMIIAEPIKITKADLNEMLTQSSDL
jgi:hypothetical protein